MREIQISEVADEEHAKRRNGSPDSPVLAHTPAGTDLDSLLDIKVVYPQSHVDVDISQVPEVFLPRSGPFRLIDYEKVYAADPGQHIFELRGIDRRAGCVVVVRPDQYVAAVLPLAGTDELAAFFRRHLLVSNRLPAASRRRATTADARPGC